MLSWFSAVTLLLISSRFAFAVDVRSCSSKKPLPLSVEVDGCKKEPCKVVNKSKIHFAINFEVRKFVLNLRPLVLISTYTIQTTFSFVSQKFSLIAEETENLRAHARAFLEGVLLPYDVPKEDLDACKFLKNASCPLQKGEIVHYELIAPVDAPMAGPTVDLEFELIGDNSKIVFCLRCKVRIVSHSSS